MKSLIIKLHGQLANNKTNAKTLVEQAKKTYESNKDLNTIITPIFEAKDVKFDNNILLSCIPYSLKDNITTSNILTTGGSKFLSNYIPPFNSTVYELLNKNGAILLSKDNLDEFGLGGTGLYSGYGIVSNPYDKTRIPGGSSSGSAVNVATGISTFAIGSDTGDSVRRPASLCGIVGYKPTYGAISRYGVLPYAPSLDHVGILAKYVADATIVANALIKYDAKDNTSTNKINDVKLENLKPLKQIKFVVFKDLLTLLDKPQQQKFNDLIKKLESLGHKVIYADFDKNLLKSMTFVYRVISYVEAYSCYSNLTGFTFGKDVSSSSDDYEEMLIKNRTAGIGNEVKRRFILGAELSNKQNFELTSKIARQLRHMINNTELAALVKGDCILMPSVCSIAPKIDNPSSGNMYDDWLMMSNFSGTPSITIPFTKLNNMPWGLTIMADVYNDMKLLNIAYTLEEILGGDNE